MTTVIESAVVTAMTRDEAQRCVEAIKGNFMDARRNLIDLYEREGWRALGYASWRECVTTEFGQHQSYLYRLLNAGLVEQIISPMGEIGQIPERQLRPLAALDDPTLIQAAWGAVQSQEKVTAQIVKQAVNAAAEWAKEYIASQGHTSLEVAKAAITERMAENRRRQTQHLAESYERQQGLSNDVKHQGSFKVVSVDDRRGFITLLAPDLAKALGTGEGGTYIVYVKAGGAL